MVIGSLDTNRNGLEVVDAIRVGGAKVVCDLIVVHQTAAEMIHACRTVGECEYGKSRVWVLCRAVPPFMPALAELEPEPLTQPVASSAWRRLARIDLPAPIQKGRRLLVPIPHRRNV
jgi:hypothetical protein